MSQTSPQLDEYADKAGNPHIPRHRRFDQAESMGAAFWTQTLDDLDGFVRREVDLA